MANQVQAAGSNFLVPNGTFFVVLIIFLIVLFVIAKFVVPPLRKVMQERHDLVQQTIEDNNKATERFEQAGVRYREALEEARAESAKIRDEARAEGQQILDEMRATANGESAKIQERSAQQLDEQRAGIVSQLRGEVGGLSSTLASRVVGTDLSANASHSTTVERLLAEHENKEGDA